MSVRGKFISVNSRGAVRQWPGLVAAMLRQRRAPHPPFEIRKLPGGRGLRKMVGLQRGERTARFNNLELIFSRAALAASSLIWKRILLASCTKLTMTPDSIN